MAGPPTGEVGTGQRMKGVLWSALFVLGGAIGPAMAILKFGEWSVFNIVMAAFFGGLFMLGGFYMMYLSLTGSEWVQGV